jgi:N-acetylglucosamine kinase-like BadF-type ATPase
LRYVLGIDAGGTKTVGLLADERGDVLAEARGAGANLQSRGELEVEKVLYGILQELSLRPVSALCLGIAGVDRASDEALIHGILKRLGRVPAARVVNDAVVALAAGAPERFGVVILAGTGSIAYGVDRQGGVARAGGYGHVLADEGSGFWLGREALRATVRSQDGRGPRTRLAELVFRELGAASVADLVPLAYERGLAPHRVASLALLVRDAADEGDATARELLERAAHELALAARSVAARLSFDAPYPVVLAGGLFQAWPGLCDGVVARLGLPEARPRLLEREPAHGAVALALELVR